MIFGCDKFDNYDISFIVNNIANDKKKDPGKARFKYKNGSKTISSVIEINIILFPVADSQQSTI